MNPTEKDKKFENCSVFLPFLVSLFFLLITLSVVSEAVFTVKDDLGDTVVFDLPAFRIVSLYAGHTENLLAIGAGEKLVAASQSDEKGVVGTLPRLGTKPGVEQIVALKPDLVLTRPMHVRAQGALYDRLRATGIRVLAFDPPGWKEFGGYIELLGKITGREREAKKAFVESFGSRETPKKRSVPDEKSARPGVFLVTNGRAITTCTPDSWAAHIIEQAGGRNVASGARAVTSGSVVASFGAERLLASEGKIDVVLLQQGSMNTLSAADFMSDKRFAKMKAVRSRRVFDVSEADISRPSLLRLQRDVVASLRRILLGEESK